MDKVPFRKWILFLLAMFAVFYLIPPALKGTVFNDFALYIFTPACCLGSGVLFGKINGWVWYYCIIVSLIFAPTLVLYFSQSDIHYMFEYGTLALMGNLIGYAFHRDKYSVDGSYAYNRLGFTMEDASKKACDVLYENGIKAEEDEVAERDTKSGVKFAIKVPAKKLAEACELLKKDEIPYELL